MKPGPQQKADVGDWPLMRRLVLDEIGSTQNEQAKALGVSQAAVGGWRSTRSNAPRSVLERLALCALASMSEEDRRRAVADGLEKLKALEPALLDS